MIASQAAKASFNTLTWSCFISQPLNHIRLKAYLHKCRNEKGLGWSSFARHYSRNHYLFSLPQPTKMFQFSWFPLHTLFYSDMSNTTWLVLGFPIRIFPDQSLLTAPRDFSQSSTSFFGNIRLGIHFVPLSTFLCIDLTSNCWEPTYVGQ